MLSPALIRILSVAVGTACLVAIAFVPAEYAAPLAAAGLALLSREGYVMATGGKSKGPESPKGPPGPKS